MSQISKIRMKKVKDMNKWELLMVKQDAIRLITTSHNPRTIQQEKKYLDKVNKRLREIDNA